MRLSGDLGLGDGIEIHEEQKRREEKGREEMGILEDRKEWEHLSALAFRRGIWSLIPFSLIT